MTGVNGLVRWGYHTAASLPTWTLSAKDAGFALTGSVREADTFRLSQSALTFRVPRQNGSVWVWPILELHIADGALIATLGPQE
jgi:hypothetical protein